ncbi:MAG: hypothetical protein HGN29_08405 [Asgard group archaeon]|nr:hypothetical protein [Asgard group archaeon]
MNSVPNIYEKKKIHFSMAGRGDPWSHLTITRKNILLALHEKHNVEELESIFGLSKKELLDEIQPLEEASLVKRENNFYIPQFFIANLEETQIIYEHSRKIGEILAESLISKWKEIEASYKKLEISQDSSLKEQAFMLIGSRILDIGLLGALVKDGSLLDSAPLRPSPNRPDAKYYFWMIEGELVHLGKYGQEEIKLPWSDWYLLNFGQSWINNKRNEKRDSREEKCKEIIESNKAKNPGMLAKLLEVPYLNEKDSQIWGETADKFSNILLKKYKESEEDLVSFYQSLGSSKYTHNSLGEFICWYVHLAYVWAIDLLVEEKLIKIPPEYYSELIIQRKEPDGFLSKANKNK